ncbi:nectin-4-like isoform X2 [Anabas testudineus]|uniref:nectin-4-like isoform X2 n=1 Tax=Anabas testudineus TaxID=64144 RepID=UPI000E461701|nr:nectin-4-like isoform X2 [Anabas testudineus]
MKGKKLVFGHKFEPRWTIQMWTMKTCFLTLMIYFTPPVMDAQQVKVLTEVTGYVGRDVILPCEFIQGPKEDHVIQVFWGLLQPEGKNILLIVSDLQHGQTVSESPLKNRVALKEQSLIIRDVEITDAGLYTCSITTFPGGIFDGKTKLFVEVHKMSTSQKMLPNMTVFGVFVLIAVTMAVATRIITFRIRGEASVGYRVCTDTGGSVM